MENLFVFFLLSALLDAVAGGVGDIGGAAFGAADALDEGVRAGSGGGGREAVMLPRKLVVDFAGVGGGGVCADVGAEGSGLDSFSTDRTFSKPSMPMIFSSILLTYVES